MSLILVLGIAILLLCFETRLEFKESEGPSKQEEPGPFLLLERDLSHPILEVRLELLPEDVVF